MPESLTDESNELGHAALSLGATFGVFAGFYDELLERGYLCAALRIAFELSFGLTH